jgi:hypothetical protein
MQRFPDSPKYRHLHLLQLNRQAKTERQVIVLTSKPQPLGAVRWYFFCPMCHRHARKLQAGAKKWFGCRICLNLTYTSTQMEDKQSGKFKAFKVALVKERRWWRKASAWSLSVSGTP